MILKIVELAPDAPVHVKKALEHIAHGSVIVAITRDHKIPHADGVWLYYEGGIFERQNRPPTLEERITYAKIAAGRAKERYPTTAKIYLPSQEGIVQTGYVDAYQWEVVFPPQPL